MGSVPPPPIPYKIVNGKRVIDLERAWRELHEWHDRQRRFRVFGYVVMTVGAVAMAAVFLLASL